MRERIKLYRFLPLCADEALARGTQKKERAKEESASA